MTDTLKVLGQWQPSPASTETLYIALTPTAVSSIVICNQQSISTTYRIAISIAGAALTSQQYIAYDSTIQGNDTVVLTIGITLAATDVIRVYSASGFVSFNLFGAQIT